MSNDYLLNYIKIVGKTLMVIYNRNIVLRDNEQGFTLVELMLSLVVLLIIAIAFFNLYISVLHSSVVAQRQAVALSLANNQMEYLKSLPYNNLAVAGGSIPSTTTIPASFTTTENAHTYVVKTAIEYVDDAYDGCGSYPNLTIEQIYCRNYPPPAGAPSLDTNPEDYKDVRVTVTDSTGLVLATLDTQIASLVAETPSNTGAVFVRVLDQNSNPLSGATVNVVNNAVSPNINVSATTDSNGIAIFYGLTPDTNHDYVVSASETGYSSLSTIAASGSLVPTYPNQSLLTQNSAYVTLTLKQQGQYSLVLETTDTSGNAIPNATIYIKGGYKKYTSTSDTTYYYDSKTSPNTSPVSDTNGLYGLSNLVPGTYIFCGDSGSTGCTVGGSTYYLAAAVPYGGNYAFNPVNVPSYSSSNPPATTFSYGGNNYLQKVRLLLTTSSSFPRIFSLSPSTMSIANDNPSNFSFAITGYNLPCTSSGSGCGTKVNLLQGTNTFAATCTGSSAGTTLNCTANLSSATTGNLNLQVISNGYTFNLPGTPLLGGIVVTP